MGRFLVPPNSRAGETTPSMESGPATLTRVSTRIPPPASGLRPVLSGSRSSEPLSGPVLAGGAATLVFGRRPAEVMVKSDVQI